MVGNNNWPMFITNNSKLPFRAASPFAIKLSTDGGVSSHISKNMQRKMCIMTLYLQAVDLVMPQGHTATMQKSQAK